MTEHKLDTIKSRKLQWAGHAWRSQNPLLRMTMEVNPEGKRHLERSRLRLEDVVKRDVKSLNGGLDWKLRIRTTDRKNRRIGCMSGWVYLSGP